MMLEKQIERAVCDYAKSKGVLTYKFTSPGHAFVPDRMMIGPDGRVWFIEFKREGGKTTPGQEREHYRMRQNRAIVFVIDDVVNGKDMIDIMLKQPC